MSVVSISIALALAGSTSARTFTVKNNCGYTIWPAVFTGTGSVRPSGPTGWEAPAGHVQTFTVDEGWTAGRVWARTECDFSDSAPATQCSTGGCNGGLQCDGTGAGVPPASLAEFTLSDANSNADWYDVSLVDGSNIPVAITNSADCPLANCPVDLNPNCPAELQQKNKAGTGVAGCKSACFANLDGNQADSANCCSGSHNTAATCPPDGVTDYHYFKDNCPNSYAYAYDESSGTALWTCDMSKKVDYTITFCP
ncbi:thaumatin [Flagelloscypha sp. PMI_526]|nr:thaumatin [Flagelloscypha sp. PMI_526]